MNDQTTILYITGVTESDFGTYVCSMQNKHGTTTRTIIISKQGKYSICPEISKNVQSLKSTLRTAFKVSVSFVLYK